MRVERNPAPRSVLLERDEHLKYRIESLPAPVNPADEQIRTTTMHENDTVGLHQTDHNGDTLNPILTEYGRRFRLSKKVEISSPPIPSCFL